MTAFLSVNVLCVYIYWPHVLNPTWPISSTFSAVCCYMFVWPTLTAKLPNLIAIRTVLLGHYTVSSTNPLIAEVGNEGATTIEGVSEAHAAGKDKRRLRSYVHLYRLHLCQLSNNSLLTARA